MNLVDILDMLFEWMSSNPDYKDDYDKIENMILKQKERFNISDQLTKILLNTAQILIK